MNYKRWILNNLDAEAESALVNQGIPELAAKVLASRGVKTISQAREMLDQNINLIADPSLMADMDKACARIGEALASGERIAVYGDYDVDGITAVSLVVSWLREKGADCIYYIPDRIEEGYGVNISAIDRLRENGVKLIITVDLGIIAIEEAEYARQNGIDMIITDHHECREQLPNAVAVINPCRPDCGYPFKTLSGVGVAFMLVLGFEGMDNIETVCSRYSDLVAVGTIADVMPLQGVNRALSARGIEEINRGRRVGLRVLINEAVQEERVNSGVIGFSVAPRINAAGRLGCADCAVELFLTDSCREAQELAGKLCELNRKRQKAENDTYEEAVAYCDSYIRKNKGRRLGALVLADKKWHIGIIGIIASRLSERYACPVFLISLDNGIGKGSARSFYGVNIINAMQKASSLFESWGGHEFAAGFTIKEENIPALRELLESMSCELGKAHIHVDAEIDVNLLSEDKVCGLDILEPYGAYNPAPVFLLKHVEITEIITLGWGKSLRLTVKKDDKSFSAFYFGMNMNRLDLSEGDTGDIVCRIDVMDLKGKKTVKLVVLDLRPEPHELEKYDREMKLYRRFISGEAVTREQAMELMPRKQEFIALLRHIKRNSGRNNRISLRFGSLCRRICREEKIDTSYAKFMVCLDILAEKKLLSYIFEDEIVEIEMLEERPANLNTSNIMIRLREALSGSSNQI